MGLTPAPARLWPFGLKAFVNPRAVEIFSPARHTPKRGPRKGEVLASDRLVALCPCEGKVLASDRLVALWATQGACLGEARSLVGDG